MRMYSLRICVKPSGSIAENAEGANKAPLGSVSPKIHIKTVPPCGLIKKTHFVLLLINSHICKKTPNDQSCDT